MKVALVQCPVWGTREPPFAVVQLSSCLKSQGHESRSYDINNYLYRRRDENLKNLWAWEQSSFWYNKESVAAYFSDINSILEEVADKILGDDPKMVGFSVAASSYHASTTFAAMLRKRNKDIAIVFGGTVFSDKQFIDAAFNDAPVDYVIAGEADVTLPELAGFVEKAKDLSACPGIYFQRNGAVVFSGERPLLYNLDVLPFMDFSDLRIDDYDDSEHISLMASRGCVWNCAFCSSRHFWSGYRAMSGERIHQEITYQRMLHKKVGHIDFCDLTFNGNMERVKEFCSLMVKYPPFETGFRIHWVANAIITPQLTPDVLELMKKAGCKRLIFGIESGSERVLKLMKKAYKPDVAKKVLKDVSGAGIAVTCNFMFGFPGETEEDFQCTLDLAKCVAGYVDRVYPSRTYCALEEYSYFHSHPEEFNIKTPFNHHLYWETIDGANTYPVRLERCRRFEELCSSLGMNVDCGVKTSVEMDNWFNLGMYYEHMRDYNKVLEYFLKYLSIDPHHKVIREKASEAIGKGDILPEWTAKYAQLMKGDHRNE